MISSVKSRMQLVMISALQLTNNMINVCKCAMIFISIYSY